MVKLFAITSIFIAGTLTAAPIWHKPSKSYRKSVHTVDALADPNCIVNPDMSAVTDENGAFTVPRKYCKDSGNAVVEMTQAEKDVVDAAAVSDAAAADKSAKIQRGMRLAAIGALLTHGDIDQATHDAWIAAEAE